MIEWCLACILFLVSVLAFIVSIRSFMEKGFLFNNTYLYASKQDREKLKKKVYYYQSAIVFLAIGLIFLLNGLDVLFHTAWIFHIVIAIVIVTLIYAIVSSMVIERRSKQQ